MSGRSMAQNLLIISYLRSITSIICPARSNPLLREFFPLLTIILLHYSQDNWGYFDA